MGMIGNRLTISDGERRALPGGCVPKGVGLPQ
jgi:hypothetical protein